MFSTVPRKAIFIYDFIYGIIDQSIIPMAIGAKQLTPWCRRGVVGENRIIVSNSFEMRFIFKTLNSSLLMWESVAPRTLGAAPAGINWADRRMHLLLITCFGFLVKTKIRNPKKVYAFDPREVIIVIYNQSDLFEPDLTVMKIIPAENF